MSTTDQEAVKEGRQPSKLEVRPLSGHIGAEIFGTDLGGHLDHHTVEQIRAALLRWRVVFFRDQRISQDQHVAFGRLFGQVTPAHPTLPAAFPEHPEILLLDQQSDHREQAAAIQSLWHTDVTFLDAPPMASILRGVRVPDYGGDTQWVNTVIAYERLSTPIKVAIEGLHARHVNRVHLKRGEVSPTLREQFQSQELSAIHPVVRVHPETGERALFVNPTFTDHIVELSRTESRHLLAMLYEHMSDAEFTVRFRWRPDSIAFWDNRATMHLAPTDVPEGARRSMQRITLAGDVPVGSGG